MNAGPQLPGMLAAAANAIREAIWFARLEDAEATAQVLEFMEGDLREAAADLEVAATLGLRTRPGGAFTAEEIARAGR